MRRYDYEADGSSHDGALAKLIKRTSVISLVLGCGSIVVAFLVIMLGGIGKATDVVKIEMLSAEETNLRQMVDAKADFTTEVLSRVVTDITLMTSFAQAALLGPAPSAAALSHAGIPAQGGFPSCYSATAPYGSLSRSVCQSSSRSAHCAWDLRRDVGEQCVSKQVPHSVYYLPGRTTASDSWDASLASHTKERLGRMASLDLAFRSLQEQYGDDGTLLYYGLEDPASSEGEPSAESIYTTFPGEEMTSYSRWGADKAHLTDGHKKCDSRWTPAPGSVAASWRTSRDETGTYVIPTHYDPRCRGWYQDAREAGKTIFTSPYTDANSGKLVMTAAAPIYNDEAKTDFAGVVAIDFSVADLDDSILTNGVLALTDDAEDNGYSYVMAAIDGGAVIHPGLDRDAGQQTIADLEYRNEEINSFDQGEYDAFRNGIVADQMRKGCSGVEVYSKNDGDGWIIAYAPETAVGSADCPHSHGFGYVVGMTVSEDAVEKPFIVSLCSLFPTKLAFRSHRMQGVVAARSSLRARCCARFTFSSSLSSADFWLLGSVCLVYYTTHRSWSARSTPVCSSRCSCSVCSSAAA
jgi:hypothetical protein